MLGTGFIPVAVPTIDKKGGKSIQITQSLKNQEYLCVSTERNVFYKRGHSTMEYKRRDYQFAVTLPRERYAKVVSRIKIR